MSQFSQDLLLQVLCFLKMLQLLPFLSVVVCTPVNKIHSVGSQPLQFLQEDSSMHIINSTLLVKKKLQINRQVDQEKSLMVNYRRLDAVGVVWKQPQKLPDTFSNHRVGTFQSMRFQKRPQLIPTRVKDVVNNHNPEKPIRRRPQEAHPSSLVSVVDNIASSQSTDVLGSRLKTPDTVHSAVVLVKDPPKNLRTTIKHDKIIVLDKRQDQPLAPPSSNVVQVEQQVQVPISGPGRKNFSVAAVMDHWSHVPIPSSGSWGQASSPVKGISRPVTAQTVVPSIPFMPFLSSLISPLLNKPLTPSAVSSGMQGIKAMQGFLRNSLMGAMFCFLPSAFIALSLTATQRAQLRKIPEINDMFGFCKKCVENLKDVKELQNLRELNWLNENLD